MVKQRKWTRDRVSAVWIAAWAPLTAWAPATVHPAQQIPANSEQRQPLFLGRTPREEALGLVPQEGKGSVRLPLLLWQRLGIQARTLARHEALHDKGPVEYEVWPTRDLEGRLTWAF